MDLSIYYEKYLRLCKMSLYLFIFIIVGFVVLTILTIRNGKIEKATRKENIAAHILSVIAFTLIASKLYLAPLVMKDINQKTIYYYEGDFEIVETSRKIIYKATFSFEGEELTLKFLEDHGYDSDLIQPGSYEGIIVYAQNAALLAYIEIYPSE